MLHTSIGIIIGYWYRQWPQYYWILGIGWLSWYRSNPTDIYYRISCCSREFITHVNQNRLLPSKQSAYRQFHSTESAILAVHNDIVRAVDQGDVGAVVLLDLSSTFDTVDHSTLLRIFQSKFSLSSPSLAWFQSYFLNRMQIFTARTS